MSAPILPADSTAPTTTAEQNLRTAGQRRINEVWELTQAAIACTVVIITSAGIFIGRVMQKDGVPFPAEWWTIVGLVIGFYFGRTNHARMGDTPPNKE